MFRRVTKIFFTILVGLLFIQDVHSSEVKWRELSKELEYTKLRISPGSIHAFRIDPAKYKFEIITAKDLGKKSSTVKKMAEKKKAILAINGGFFSPEYDSLGLLINDGKEINPLKKTSWWSVFYIKNEKAKIIHTNSFKKSAGISMAIQAGPRLVVNGSIPKLKLSLAERSAICVGKKKDVIIVVTENLLISTLELAEYMRKSEKDGGLGCVTALNLDGGSSTQLYADIESFKLSIPGMKPVANAIAVYPKK